MKTSLRILLCLIIVNPFWAKSQNFHYDNAPNKPLNFLDNKLSSNITLNKQAPPIQANKIVYLPTKQDMNAEYFWNRSVFMTESYSDGTPITKGAPNVLSKKGQLFKIVGYRNDTVVIQIYQYSSDPNFFKYNYENTTLRAGGSSYTSLTKSQKDARDYGVQQKYFCVLKEEIEKHATRNEKIGVSASFGILDLPFRFYPQSIKRDFTGTFNLSGALGMKIAHKEWRKFTWSIITAYGISNTVLDNSTVTSNSDLLEETNKFTSFSFAFGPMVEYENLQIGLFMGMDRISRQNQKTYGWIYQGNTWFSLGFGYSIFSIEKPNKNKETGKENQQKFKQR